MAKRTKVSPGDYGGAAGFRPIGTILFWGFWSPILYIIVMPWLSFSVVKFWADPIFAGFFNAMASPGWLIASVLVFSWAAYTLVTGYYRQHQARKKSGAPHAANKVQSNAGR